jgi:hypothetical protein
VRTQVLIGVGLGAEVEDGLEAHLLQEREVLLVGVPRTIPAHSNLLFNSLLIFKLNPNKSNLNNALN